MADAASFDKARILPFVEQALAHGIPHGAALGLKARDIGPGWAILELPWDPKLVGDPATGVLHGGAVTSLLDQACGMSVFMKLARPTRIATLDLRIDYLGPAETGRSLFGRAECYRLARHVAFVRAEAFHDEPRVEVAASMATFMIFDEGRSPLSDALKKEGG
jgi:uncharacterized protein (TIGR00369 family)